MPYILIHCELEALIASGGLSGKQQTYALLDERVPKGGQFRGEDPLVELTRRYLMSHGPATVRDVSWWSGLTMGDIRKALAALGSEVEQETVDGLTFWAVPRMDGDPPTARGVHLLQAYDETIVGYTESRWFGDPRAEAVFAAWRDPGRPSGVILAGGRVAGHWRRTVERDVIEIEALLYEPRRRGLAKALEAAAEEHAAFFGRPVSLEMELL